MQAIDAERVRGQVQDVEAKRGPLEGLQEIADDPEYLAELSAAAVPREGEGQGVAPDSDSAQDISVPIRFLDEEGEDSSPESEKPADALEPADPHDEFGPLPPAPAHTEDIGNDRPSPRGPGLGPPAPA